MSAYDSTFKRVEKKYRVSASARRAVEAAMSSVGLMDIDAYGRSRVTSLYLDTPCRFMIARSIEKPLYKEKLRLRVYGEEQGRYLMRTYAAYPLCRASDAAALSDADVEARVRTGCVGCDISPRAFDVFFGIKKKFKGIVYKRRLALSLPASLAFLSGMTYEQACTRWPLIDSEEAHLALTAQTRQISRELAAAMDRHLPLVPSMGITCEREAWAMADGETSAVGALRITFDDELEYLDCFEGLDGDERWRPIIAPDESIMEIKCIGAYPLWLVEVLSENGIYPVSFTKYGNAYKMCESAKRPRLGVSASRCVMSCAERDAISLAPSCAADLSRIAAHDDERQLLASEEKD